MKYSLTIAVSTIALAAFLTPALAQDPPASKGPTATMGDEGKLPATGAGSDRVPDMGASGASSGAGTGEPKGGAHRMGDEGKLPATGTGSDRVPKMTPPADK